MAARALKRATLLLCISSVVLGLLISNKALECEREAAVEPRGDPAAATSDTLTRTTTAFDTAGTCTRRDQFTRVQSCVYVYVYRGSEKVCEGDEAAPSGVILQSIQQ